MMIQSNSLPFVLVLVLSSTCLLFQEACGQATSKKEKDLDDTVSSYQAVARRQDGVFFGLGGLDARYAPFDLDAFFEYAAPTRTTAKVNRAAASSTQAPRQTTTPSPTTQHPQVLDFSSSSEQPVRTRPSTRLDKESSGRPSFKTPLPHDIVSNGRVRSGTAVLHRVPSDAPAQSQRPQQLKQPSEKRQRHQFPVNQDRELFHQEAPAQQKLSPLPARPSFVDDVSDAQQQSSSGGSRLQQGSIGPGLDSSEEKRRPHFETDVVKPSQHVSSLRPSIVGKFPLRKPEHRFRSGAKERPFSVIPTPKPILTFPSQSRQPPPIAELSSEQRFTNNNDNADDDRSFPSQTLSVSKPELPASDSAPAESAERAPSTSFEPEENNNNRQRVQIEPQYPDDEDDSVRPNSQNTEYLDSDLQRPAEESQPFYDEPSQDPPAQEVDNETIDSPRNFRPSSSNERERPQQYYAPSSAVDEDNSNLPESPSSGSAVREESGDVEQPSRDVPEETVASSYEDAPADDDRYVPQQQEEQQERRPEVDDSNYPPVFRPSSSRSRQHVPIYVPSNDAERSFVGDEGVDDNRSRHPVDEELVSDEYPSRQHRRPVQQTAESDVRDLPPPPPPSPRYYVPSNRDIDSDRVSTRVSPIIFKNLASTTPYFFSGDNVEEGKGQLLASFAKVTEPTNFEAVTTKPTRLPQTLTVDTRSRVLTKTLRRKPNGRRRVQRPKLDVTTAVFSIPHPTVATTMQTTTPAKRKEILNQTFIPRQSTVITRDFPPEVADFGQFAQPSIAQGTLTPNKVVSGFQKTPTTRRLPTFPTTEAPRSISGRRFNLLRGRTTSSALRPVMSNNYVTENTIDDVRSNSLQPRNHEVEQTFQDSRVSSTVSYGQLATSCSPSACHLPKCFCGGSQLRPGNLRPEDTPQIIVLTFDDAVNDLNWALYTRLFFKDRRNPNGCPILSTFYVSHEWTDYSKVQNLYAQGHEIASHSISHGDGRDYSKKKWYDEIYGEKEILNVYGNVRLEDVKGMRSPFLAMGGDKQFSMLYETNFTYDTSMTVTDVHPPYWPYTLDYAIPHRCAIPPCPKLSYPGFWEIPMVALTDLNGGKCSMADGCSHATTEEGIYEMLMKNFERHYTSNRAPFGLYYHASWFLVPHRQEGFVKFLEDVLELDDVYFVTALQMLEWVKNPTPISKIKHFEPWMCNKSDRPPACSRPRSCELRFKGDVRYMSTCHTCPDVYPWVGNTGITKSAHTITP